MPATRHRSYPDYIDRTIETVRLHADADNCWPSWANIFADEIEDLRADLHRQHLNNLRMRRAAKRLVEFAEGVNENVMGNGLAYRRDALRHVIGEMEALLERLARDQCPACGQATTIEDDEAWCEYCGWDDYGVCSHGISNKEFCSKCPSGGV